MGLSLEEKAKQYLADGRVVLYSVEPWYAHAIVTGSEPYEIVLRGRNDGNSSCSCRAGTVGTLCSHVMAVRMVTDLAEMPHEKPTIPSSQQHEFNKLLGIIGRSDNE